MSLLWLYGWQKFKTNTLTYLRHCMKYYNQDSMRSSATNFHQQGIL